MSKNILIKNIEKNNISLNDNIKNTPPNKNKDNPQKLMPKSRKDIQLAKLKKLNQERLKKLEENKDESSIKKEDIQEIDNELQKERERINKKDKEIKELKYNMESMTKNLEQFKNDVKKN